MGGGRLVIVVGMGRAGFEYGPRELPSGGVPENKPPPELPRSDPPASSLDLPPCPGKGAEYPYWIDDGQDYCAQW